MGDDEPAGGSPAGGEPAGAGVVVGPVGDDEPEPIGNAPPVEGAVPLGAVAEGDHEEFGPAGDEPGIVAADAPGVLPGDESALEYPDGGARLGAG